MGISNTTIFVASQKGFVGFSVMIHKEMSLTFPRVRIGFWSYGGEDYWGDQAQSDVVKLDILAAGISCACS